MSEDNRITPYPLRIDPELRADLEAAAKNAGRSLNSEISRRLYASLSRHLDIDDGDDGDADLMRRIANDVFDQRLRLGNEIRRQADSPLDTKVSANKLEETTLTIEVSEQTIGWFQTFADRAYFDTFRDLAENFDEEEASALRDAVYAINTAIIKARGVTGHER